MRIEYLNSIFINTSVEIKIIDKNLTLYLNFSGSKINISIKAKYPVKLSIQAELMSYINYIFKKKRDKNFRIIGDAEYGVEFEKLFSDFKLYSTISDFISDFKYMVNDYFVYESKCFPQKQEILDYIKGVDDARLRIDKIEARINRISQLA